MATNSDPEERQALLELTQDSNARAFLVLAWRTVAPDYRAELVQLEDDVSSQFLTYARRASEELVEGTEIDYDPEWILKDHEFFTLTEPDLPSANLFEELADFQNLDSFSKKKLTKPKLYVVAVQSSGQTGFFGKRMAYLQVLNQKAGVFSAVWDGSTFNTLTDSVATFSQSFDWILWHDQLHIIDALGFHGEFRDVAALWASPRNVEASG